MCMFSLFDISGYWLRGGPNRVGAYFKILLEKGWRNREGGLSEPLFVTHHFYKENLLLCVFLF